MSGKKFDGSKYGSKHRKNVKELFAGPGPHICWLCSEPILMDAPRGDPQGPEADHYKPVSKFPELRFDLANLKKSHLACNRSRSDGDPNPGLTRTSRDWSRKRGD